MAAVILSNEQHQDVKVDRRARNEYGDLVNRAIVLTSEFGAAHKEFPILIRQEEASGGLQAHAVLGFDKGENLFILDENWSSQYVPAALARGPFSLGYVKQSNDETAADVRIMIDENNPRVGHNGEAIFAELGGEKPYLDEVRKILQIIDIGLNFDPVFYKKIVELELLEPVKISIRLTSEVEYTFSNYLSINQAKFSALNGEDLHDLHVAGLLGPIFYLISSLDNFSHLIALKNAKNELA